MALPLVAVVGRPNVGKSTFVNRIIGADDAIVHEMRGVTRDRSYHEASWNGVAFTVVDTGGIEMGSDDDFQASITSQALTATNEADVIVLIVDSRRNIDLEFLFLPVGTGSVTLRTGLLDNLSGASAD